MVVKPADVGLIEEEVQVCQDTCLTLRTVGVTPVVGDTEGAKAKTCGRNATEGPRVIDAGEGPILDHSCDCVGLLPKN